MVHELVHKLVEVSTFPSSLTANAFTPDVPKSIPNNTDTKVLLFKYCKIYSRKYSEVEPWI